MSQATLSPPKPLAVHAPRVSMHAPMHPIHLTGLRHDSRALDGAPLIVERRDQEFVEGLLADLGDKSRQAALLSSTPELQGTAMRVFQPLQRVFNMLVLEVFCDIPGQPRLDPARIDSSGFVLRRVDGTRHLAWLKAGTRVFGWEAVDEDLDPARDRRANAVTLGHPLLDARAPSQRRIRTAGSARLASATEAVGEDIQPLFVAPPEVCKGAAKTLLFGNLRVASGELSETPAAPPAFGTDQEERDLLAEQLVTYLREGGSRGFPVPAQRSFSTEDARRAAQTAPGVTLAPLSRNEYDALDKTLGLLLRQLHSEFDLFGTGTGATALQGALRSLRVETDVAAANGQPARIDYRDALEFLMEARDVLIDAVPGKTVGIPNRFGAVNHATATAIFSATLLCLQQQFARVLPAAGRFERTRNGADPHFVVRAFVRLKPEYPGCQGRLVWSLYSAPFIIAPWFESSGAPVPVIPMPDLMDREQLKRVKPTVAFSLPPKLAALLQNDPKDLRDGKGDGGNGLGLGWICSFSLPIITLCAFIVLNIFLQLFNLIFFWLPFLKICIPIPKAKE